MPRLLSYCFAVGIVAWMLSGCATSRPAKEAGNIDAFVPPARAIVQADGTVIRPQPAEQQANVDDTVTVEIRLDNVTNLAAADIQLQFAPNILQAQDANPNEEGVQIEPGDFLSSDFVVFNEVDNATGMIRYALTQVGTTQPVSGSGLLATIIFQAVAQGTSELTFTLANLATSDGQPIAVTSQSGEIRVGQATAEPTNTSTVTPSPTSTSIPGEDTPTPSATPIQPTDTPVPVPTPTPLPPPTPTNTPAPPVTKIPRGAIVGFCYRVQEGDTLYSVGHKFGVDPHYVNIINELDPPGYIFTHQALFIPNSVGYGPKFYIVQAGDTLSSIANQCHLPVAVLADVNNLAENIVLQPGHALEIPIPPFPSPSRFPYPPSVFPPIR